MKVFLKKDIPILEEMDYNYLANEKELFNSDKYVHVYDLFKFNE